MPVPFKFGPAFSCDSRFVFPDDYREMTANPVLKAWMEKRRLLTCGLMNDCRYRFVVSFILISSRQITVRRRTVSRMSCSVASGCGAQMRKTFFPCSSVVKTPA